MRIKYTATYKQGRKTFTDIFSVDPQYSRDTDTTAKSIAKNKAGMANVFGSGSKVQFVSVERLPEVTA